jgi:hypothetical protein
VRVKVYPADTTGCGYFRLIWVSEALRAAGHDVEIRPPGSRDIQLRMTGEKVSEILNVDGDVYVFQRLTHNRMAQCVPLLRSMGVAVVVDVDDDLSSIHPRNPAHDAYHPRRGDPHHNWHNLAASCRDATMVTVSTPGLLGVYAKHGRGHVLYNHLPEHYYDVLHEDSDRIGWPASLQSHPDDPSAVGGAVSRLCDRERPFHVVADRSGVADAFSLRDGVVGVQRPISITEWPEEVAKLGIGIAPLADTRFNACKSWLKPLELSALGVPWIGSPRTEYERLHRMGAGVLAGSPGRWFKELRRLSDSPALRLERAAEARAVAETLRINDNAWRWLEAWERAVSVQSGEPARTQLV